MSKSVLVINQSYRALSPARVWRHASRAERARIFGLWVLLCAASVGLGLASVIWQWSGLPLVFGGVEVYVTVYPPLLICLLLTLSLGWWWGAIPAYFSTLTLALYAGMPLPWALLFACANPLGLAIMVIGYQAIAARRDLRDTGSLLFYVQLSFVGSIFSSSGALIWSYTNHIDSTALLPIWQGWWLGAFLQSVLLVGVLMALLWPRIQRWQGEHEQWMAAATTDTRRYVLHLLGSVTAGVLIYGFVTIQLASHQVELVRPDGGDLFAQAVAVLQQTTWVFYWVFSLNILFIAFFGYQLFIQWQKATDQLLGELHQANLELEMLAHIDGLSGLLNRRAMDECLHTEWQRSKRIAQSAALVMLDIDHFKQINDQHGHPAGDDAIRQLASVIKSMTREIDLIGRYGGEEFLLVLPQADAQGALAFAERLRKRVAAMQIRYEADRFQLTISLGVAVIDPADTSPEGWLERADQALYRAKYAGRNQTVLASVPRRR